MQKFFEVTVELKIETETKGEVKIKKVRENYLVDALSVTEAEARVVKQFEAFSQDYQVVAVRGSKIIDVIYAEEAKPLKSMGMRLKDELRNEDLLEGEAF